MSQYHSITVSSVREREEWWRRDVLAMFWDVLAIISDCNVWERVVRVREPVGGGESVGLR